MPKEASVLIGPPQRTLPPEDVLFGTTRAMQAVREKVEKLAAATVPVLIRGEGGAGKELIAQLIHRKSAFRSGPFVTVTCPAIPGTALETELFGEKTSSTTGAAPPPSVIAKRAAGGTLFFDEIGDLEKGLQGKLLNLLQEGQLAGGGGRVVKPSDVRIICSASNNLEEDIRNGAFRPDLFYRVNVASIELPPLRERTADLQILIDYFMRLYSEKFQCTAEPIPSTTLRLFESFCWPGNIRELENLIKRYVILGSESELVEPPGSRSVGFTAPKRVSMPLKQITKQASRDLEREIILQVLAENHWNRRKAARMLEISYRALLYKLKNACLTGPRLPGEARVPQQSSRFGC